MFGLLAWLFILVSKEVDTIANSQWKEVYSCTEFDGHQLPGTPSSYAVVKDGKRLLIDCPEQITPDLLPSAELVLLTHSHRDTVPADGVPLTGPLLPFTPPVRLRW